MTSPPLLTRFSGSPAVVTGAGAGIGRAVALRLAELGFDVASMDVRQTLAERTADEIRSMGQAAVGLGVDVSDRTAVADAASVVVDQLGAPRIVVVAAGVSLRPLRPIWENSAEDWSWIMGVNFWGVVNTVSAFLPGLLAIDGARHVVTINSMSQFRGMSGHSAYVTSKRAAEGYSECLAAEVSPRGIGVTVVYPGRVRTDLATSENLRPLSERSSSRTLTALEIPTSSLVNNPELTPDRIADSIVDGIEHGMSHVLTHQPPTEVMAGRLSGILGAPVTVGDPLTHAATAGASGRQRQ